MLFLPPECLGWEGSNRVRKKKLPRLWVSCTWFESELQGNLTLYSTMPLGFGETTEPVNCPSNTPQLSLPDLNWWLGLFESACWGGALPLAGA